MTTASGRSDGPVITVNHPPIPLDNVRMARILALLVDAVFITILIAASAIVIFFLGFLTLGLGWALYFVIWPAVALLYYFFTLGINGRTVGMSIFSIELREADGGHLHPVIGLAHPVLFWFMVTIPLILLVSIIISMMDDRKRMLHDIVLRVVMVRAE